MTPRAGDRLSAGAEESLRYYRELGEASPQADRSPLLGELGRVVSELEVERKGTR